MTRQFEFDSDFFIAFHRYKQVHRVKDYKFRMHL